MALSLSGPAPFSAGQEPDTGLPSAVVADTQVVVTDSAAAEPLRDDFLDGRVPAPGSEEVRAREVGYDVGRIDVEAEGERAPAFSSSEKELAAALDAFGGRDVLARVDLLGIGFPQTWFATLRVAF